jgi:serine/threonine protein kinase
VGAPARGILNPPEATGMPYWTINPYVGCAFGCAYCYARDTHRWTAQRVAEADGGAARSAPEQVRPEPYHGAGTATDVYGLALALYETLTGDLPYVTDDDPRSAMLGSAPVPPSTVEPALPGGVDDLLLPALAKDPADRPDLDAFRNQATARVEEVLQAELGVKINTPNYGAFLTAFYSSLTNIPFDDQEVQNGQIVTNTQFANSLTPGIEAEFNSQFGDFTGNLTATLQQPEYRDYQFQTEADEDGQLESFDFGGNRVRRQPRYIVSVNPRYGLGFAEVSTTLRFVDARFTSDSNTGIELPSYYVWDASISTTQGPVTLKLAGTNLTNTIGLTEGNPRTGQQIGQVTNIFQARPILGRRFNLSLQYDF